MRKCKCKYWIPAEWITLDGTNIGARQLKEGTRCYSEETEGMFHEWGLDIEDTASYSVGIVELPNGKIVTTPASNIQFIEPAKAQ